MTDASESLSKAKQFLPHLQRGGKLAAVVEFCSTGSRFKVAVPSQNCKLTLVKQNWRGEELSAMDIY